MCSPECFKWAARNVTRADIQGKRVIEVGAYDVNGSLRYVLQMLEPSEYIGTDILAGPGVDIVCPADKLLERFGEHSFDVVVSANVLEHINDWRSAVFAMKRLLRPGGVLLVIAPCIWVYHAHPGDYWRYTAEDFRAIFGDMDVVNLQQDPAPPALAYGMFRKREGSKDVDLSDYPLYSIITGQREKAVEASHFRRLHFLKTLLKYKLKIAGLAVARRLFRQV